MSSDRDNSQLMAGFGQLINAISGGGDVGQPFPQSDAEDFRSGARFIPGEVTIERRAGRKVTFNRDCTYSSCCWYWEMTDGSRVYHYDRNVSDQIGRRNFGEDYGTGGNTYPGPCPSCGNPFTTGGTKTVEDIQKSH